MTTVDRSSPLQKHFTPPLGLPPLEVVGIPSEAENAALRTLETLCGRVYLRRFLRFAATQDSSRARWSVLVDATLAMSVDGATRVFTDPTMTTLVNAEPRGIWSPDELVDCAARLVDEGARGWDTGRHVRVSAIDEFWRRTRIPGSPEPYVEAGPGFLTEQQDIVDEALVLIGDLWPSAHASVLASVRRVIFLDPTADKPGYTAHQSRGLVWARPGEPHELAQVLVHEGGHNILCSVIDLCALADNQREAVESPFGDDRPVYGVLHAAISFARESLFARMLLERGHRTSLGYDLAEYAADVTALARTSIGRLEEDAQLTSLGADLVRGIAHQALV